MFEEIIGSISEIGGLTYCQNMFAIDQFKQIFILSLLYPLYPRGSGLLLFSEKLPSLTDTTLVSFLRKAWTAATAGILYFVI